MCLTKVTEREPKRKAGTGWKVLRKYKDDSLHTTYFQHRTCPQPGRWITDRARGTIDASDGDNYPTGFHIFQYKKDAIAWSQVHACDQAVILKAWYKEARTRGTISINIPVIVARQIYIEQPND